MDGSAVPPALRERLGPEATGGLLNMLETARGEWRADVIEVCATRFERRLVEEVSKLRLEMVHGDAALRQEMTALGASLHQEMTELGASLRREMTELGASLRREMMELGAGLRQEMSAGRFELLKWCFLFWAGQVVAVAGLLGVLLRFARP